MVDGFDPNKVNFGAGHFIGGRITAGPGASMDVRRPSDGRVYAQLPLANPAKVDEAVENAWTAFRTSGWVSQPPRDRIAVLRRWADLIAADSATLGPLEALGSTRPIADVLAWDIPYVAECIRFFSEFADKIGGEVAATSPDKLGLTITEPYGVVAAIAPWNFPLVMAVTKIAPALAAGNAVVLKPSEMTPFSVLRLAQLAIEAGIPEGIFNIVQGDGRTAGDALCRHPKIAKVTFTGSTATGRAIMAACAESGPKPVTLELGGKSPQLVFADTPDPAKTAAAIARAITLNGGQVCVAGSRLLVQKGIAEEITSRIGEAFAKLKPGATWTSGTTLAPIISGPQFDRIDAIVQRTAMAGAEILCGGGRAPMPQEGAYYLPTLIAGVDGACEAVREEIFGPVLTVQTFTDEEEGFALANDSAYGLAAGVHTGDVARTIRAVRAIEAGTIWINRYGRSHDMILPTGGYKQSGIGKDLGRQAYEANLKVKTALMEI